MAPNRNDDTMSRRRFLRLVASGSATVAGGSLLAACGAATQVPAANTEPTADAGVGAQATQAKPTVAVASGQTLVTVMHRRSEFGEEAQKAFEDANPDIKIEVIEDDPKRLFAMYAAGNPPDLIRTEAPAIPQFLARDMLLDLTPYFETSTMIKMDDLAPANNYYRATSPLTIGSGNIYGMVKDWSPDFTLFANTKLFDDAGVAVPDPTTVLTYAELGELAQQVAKKEGDRVVAWGFSYPPEWVDRTIANHLAEMDLSLYNEDFTQLNLVANDEARKMVQYYFDLAKADATPSPLNPSPTWPGEDFTKGNVGLVQYGYWYSAMAESDVTSGNVVMLPAPTWSGTRRDPTISATGTVISSGSKNPDAAWRVFEWFNAGEPATARFSSGWGVPSFETKYDLIPQETDFQKQAFSVLTSELPYTDASVQFNPYLGSTAFSDSWTKNLEQALRDQISFDQMLENIESEINMAIKDGQDRIG